MVLKPGVQKLRQWEIDKAWANGHDDQIADIWNAVAGLANPLRKGTYEEDTEGLGDYIYYSEHGNCLAARVRRWRYFLRYGRQLTIRLSRPTGAKTEYAKIKSGMGDWYLYAYEKQGRLEAWLFIDLHIFRDSGCIDNPDGKKTNQDGTTFYYWSLPRLKRHGCIVAEG